MMKFIMNEPESILKKKRNEDEIENEKDCCVCV